MPPSSQPSQAATHSAHIHTKRFYRFLVRLPGGTRSFPSRRDSGKVGCDQAFLDGRLDHEEGSIAFVAGERRLPLSGYEFDGRPEAGAPATLGVRPEHITTDGGGACRIGGLSVEMVEPMGADSLVWCRDGKLSLGVRMPGERSVELGTALPLGLTPAQFSLFDGDGRRL